MASISFYPVTLPRMLVVVTTSTANQKMVSIDSINAVVAPLTLLVTRRLKIVPTSSIVEAALEIKTEFPCVASLILLEEQRLVRLHPHLGKMRSPKPRTLAVATAVARDLAVDPGAMSVETAVRAAQAADVVKG
jgi:hypothetical protein